MKKSYKGLVQQSLYVGKRPKNSKYVVNMKSTIEYEEEFDVYAIDDGSNDFLLRVNRLVKIYNVIQLKNMRKKINGCKCIPLGPIANTINLPFFKDECANLNLLVEFNLEDNK